MVFAAIGRAVGKGAKAAKSAKPPAARSGSHGATTKSSVGSKTDSFDNRAKLIDDKPIDPKYSAEARKQAHKDQVAAKKADAAKADAAKADAAKADVPGGNTVGPRPDGKGGFVNEKGRKVDAQGNLINDKGQRVNKQGQTINEEGKLVNDKGERINADGSPLTRAQRFGDHYQRHSGKYQIGLIGATTLPFLAPSLLGGGSEEAAAGGESASTGAPASSGPTDYYGNPIY